MHTIETEQDLPIDIQTAWEFFSSPENLKKITPKHLGFVITSKHSDEKMYPGMIITYRIKPILGFPIKWATEITHVRETEYFIDEQRFGPYKFWHHKHKFIKTETGIKMIDTVNYKLPLGFIGRIINKLFVKKQLKEIFDYRYKVLEERFG